MESLDTLPQYTISLPLAIKLGKKVYSINLNGYRNWHYRLSNDLKKAYKAYIKESVELLPKLNKISLTYIVYARSARRFDTMNVISITSKFFEDALVEANKIEDDNYDFIPEHHSYFGGIRKTNPRVDVIIKEIE